MPALIAGADKILVPVLPSDIDIHACSRTIANLLLVARCAAAITDWGSWPTAYAATPDLSVADALPRDARYPIVATFRDSQCYIRSAELGVGIHEMKPHLVQETWNTGNRCWSGWLCRRTSGG